MKNKNWLIVLVVLLIFGFAGETAYLWKIKSENEYHKSLIAKQHHQNIPTNPGHRVVRSMNSQWDPIFGFGTSDYDPFAEMERIQQRMNRMFRDSFSRATSFDDSGFLGQNANFEPEIDVDESNTHYIVKIDLPGMEKDQINVEVKDNFLVISGNRKTENEDKNEHGNFYRIERSFGSFSRAIPVPADADQNDVNAEYKNGVLVVKIAKLAPAEGAQKTGSKVEIK